MDPTNCPERRTVINKEDMVNSPSHYNNRTYRGELIEAIDLIEIFIQGETNPAVAYNVSNVLKYLLRFRTKGKSYEDLKKAKWYLERAINHVGEEEVPWESPW